MCIAESTLFFFFFQLHNDKDLYPLALARWFCDMGVSVECLSSLRDVVKNDKGLLLLRANSIGVPYFLLKHK